MKRTFLFVALTVGGVVAGPKGWKLPPETAAFEKRPGYEAAMVQCSLCHSADYIAIQPPMNRAAWTATVTKMKDKYGAPLPSEALTNVVDYLVKTYGVERAK
jgi:hypothetical protein